MQVSTIDEVIRESAEELLSCKWVRSELNNVDFGDYRLRNRFLIIAKRLAKQPSSNICQCAGDWGLVKSVYRFFDNEKVTAEKLLEPHQIKTAWRTARHTDKILIVQDTTKLNYSNMKSARDLGHISINKHVRGLMMHTSLALTSTGIPLGIINQKIWSRKEYRNEPNKNIVQALPIEEKESFRWLESMRQYNPQISNSDCITVCDREAHIYELFAEAQLLQTQVLIRAKNATSIGAKSDKINIEKQKIAKTYSITVPDKAREKQRKATVQLRFNSVELRQPRRLKNSKKYLNQKTKLYYVSLMEIDVPKGEEQIIWLLLTNLKINSIKQAKQAVDWYKKRWQIEIFFKILKSGCKIEDSLLRKNCRREPYISLQSIIAWRLLLMVNYKKAQPNSPATDILTQLECDALVSSLQNNILRNTSINVKSAINMIARLGGYLNRKNDPPPGPAAIWRGWDRLQDFSHMFMLANRNTS